MALNIAVKIEVIKGFYHDRESITDRGTLWRPKMDEAGFVSWVVIITIWVTVSQQASASFPFFIRISAEIFETQHAGVANLRLPNG